MVVFVMLLEVFQLSFLCTYSCITSLNNSSLDFRLNGHLVDYALGDTKVMIMHWVIPKLKRDGKCTGVLFQRCVMMMRMWSHCRSVKPSQSWPRCTTTLLWHDLSFIHSVIQIFYLFQSHFSHVDVCIIL